MASIYLDHNATTPVRSEVFDAMEPFFRDRFGNASSIHRYGQDARAAVEEARARVAGLVNARPGEVYFTSGGTESDNLAIKGTAYARKAYGRHIITTNIEHSAVLNSCAFLEREGFEVTYLPVDEYGRVDPGQVEDALTGQTILVSIMHANNEIGTVQSVGEIGRIARDRGVCFHTDAVQSAGKLPVDVEAMHADLLSLSGHKIYGPKGVGAIYIRKGVEIEPTAHGGHHENDVRSGTENTVGIVGLGKAAELAAEERESEYRHLFEMRDALETRIRVEIEGVRVNGHPERRLPGTLNVSFPGGGRRIADHEPGSRGHRRVHRFGLHVGRHRTFPRAAGAGQRPAHRPRFGPVQLRAGQFHGGRGLRHGQAARYRSPPPRSFRRAGTRLRRVSCTHPP